MVFWNRRQKQSGIDERIRHAIAELRPLLPSHTVTIALVAFEMQSGVAEVRMDGDCAECDMPVSQLLTAIEARLRMQIPEIRSVRLAGSDG
jgi:Fe-S cluster biogenesis protein NfuA